jgi:hypothetical protein
MIPNILHQILPSFLKSKFSKPSIMPPNMFAWTYAYPCANIVKVASLLLMSVVSTKLWLWIPSSLISLDDGIMGHGGTTMMQFYWGYESQVTAVFPMKTESEMAGTLEDFICFHGAPNALFRYNAKAQIGRAVQEILRMYIINDFQCEPHHQHQNLAEHWIQEVK